MRRIRREKRLERGLSEDARRLELKLPRFSGEAMRRQIAWDSIIRWGLLGLMLAMLVWVLDGESFGKEGMGGVVILLLVMGWFALNMVNARTGRELAQISGVVESDPKSAENWISLALGRKPLLKWVRLMIYHRLAMVRHRQHEFAESAEICSAVLAYRLGPAEGTRSHLLLMLTEASLEMGDMGKAYASLTDLYKQKVSLIEALQRLSLQIRYELVTGNYTAAATNIDAKLEMIELLPAAQCGVVHEMLSIAASQTGGLELAEYLDKRAKLLCETEQLRQAMKGIFLPNVQG